MGCDIQLLLKNNYGLDPKEITLISKNLNRSVFKITTNQETFALKFFRSISKANRISSAQNYLYLNHAPVLNIIPTLTGDLFLRVEKSSACILFPWINGTYPKYDNEEMLKKIIQVLAEFHYKSKGFFSYPNCKLKFHNLPQEYFNLNHKLKEIHDFMMESQKDPFTNAFLENYSFIEKRISWVNNNINKTDYIKVVQQHQLDPHLIHGDYSRINLLLQDEVITVIDLDSVKGGLPIWDLSRLIYNVDNDLKNWSEKRFLNILKVFETQIKITGKEEDILMVDQVFPYQAISLALDYYSGKQSNTYLEELENCISIDRGRLKSFNVTIDQ